MSQCVYHHSLSKLLFTDQLEAVDVGTFPGLGMGVRDVAIVYFDGVLKLLGLLHCAFGGLLIVMGIVVRVAVDHWTSIMLLAIWIGIFVSSSISFMLPTDFSDFYSKYLCLYRRHELYHLSDELVST